MSQNHNLKKKSENNVKRPSSEELIISSDFWEKPKKGGVILDLRNTNSCRLKYKDLFNILSENHKNLINLVKKNEYPKECLEMITSNLITLIDEVDESFGVELTIIIRICDALSFRKNQTLNTVQLEFIIDTLDTLINKPITKDSKEKISCGLMDNQLNWLVGDGETGTEESFFGDYSLHK